VIGVAAHVEVGAAFQPIPDLLAVFTQAVLDVDFVGLIA
jgi:hypothetical protein